MAAVVARAVEEPEGGGEKEKEEEENKRRRTNHVLDYATQQDAQELREKYTNAKPFPAARTRRTCGHMFFTLSFCLSSNTNALHYSNTHASLVTRW